jgi:hypothetical protein
MASELTQAMIVNAAVWGSVLGTDLGPARKVGTMRIVRPLVVAAVIVPLFVKKPDLKGTSLEMQIAGILLGALCGLAAIALMTIYRSPQTGKPVSRAGWSYAALWTVVIGARAVFSYGNSHWWPDQLVHWGVSHKVSVADLTDSLVFMAIAMLVTRTLGIWARAASLSPGPSNGSRESEAYSVGIN